MGLTWVWQWPFLTPLSQSCLYLSLSLAPAHFQAAERGCGEVEGGCLLPQLDGVQQNLTKGEAVDSAVPYEPTIKEMIVSYGILDTPCAVSTRMQGSGGIGLGRRGSELHS